MPEDHATHDPAARAYRISDVARLLGVSASTLRLWEQHDLLTPRRLPSGQRVFAEEDLRRGQAIRRMRMVDGLSMAAIRQAIARSEGEPEAEAPPGADARLGRRFKQARRRAGLTLRAAAGALELAPSFLSTFERTSRGATVATLKRLASLYGVTVTALYAPDPGEEAAGEGARTVVPAGQELVAPSFSDEVEIRRLADNLALLDCQKWVLQPGAGSASAYAHEGEEFIHVLAGAFEVTLGDGAPQRLGPGDSISFASTVPHSWRALGEGPTTLLWVNTPKTF